MRTSRRHAFAAAYTFTCMITLMTMCACAPDYPRLKAGQVRAFRIPLGPGGAAADSALCLFSVPEGYTPDRPFPLLVALHGGGSSAALFHDLWGPVTRSCGFVLVTPQGEVPGPGGVGYGWGPDAEQTVGRCIDVVLGRVNIERSKIFLTGFSQGGHLTYAMAISHPHVFAGIAPIGVGYDLPAPSAGDDLRNMRIYIGHGETEPGLEEVRGLAAALQDRGCDVRLVVYPGTGHGVPQPVASELRSILEYFGASG